MEEVGRDARSLAAAVLGLNVKSDAPICTVRVVARQHRPPPPRMSWAPTPGRSHHPRILGQRLHRDRRPPAGPGRPRIAESPPAGLARPGPQCSLGAERPGHLTPDAEFGTPNPTHLRRCTRRGRPRFDGHIFHLTRAAESRDQEPNTMTRMASPTAEKSPGIPGRASAAR